MLKLDSIWFHFFISVFCLSSSVIAAGTPLQHIDDFEDGTTQQWQEGPASPNPPENVADGGPSGIGDNFLRNVSDGSGAGGSMIIFNTGENWTGDFASQRVNQISLDLNNSPSSEGPLHIRVAIQGHDQSNTLLGRYVSKDAVVVPNDGNWHSITIPFGESAMSAVVSEIPFSETVRNIAQFRLIHRPTLEAGEGYWAVSFLGLAGFDNIAKRARHLVGDYNGDGKSDILWRNAITGENHLYVMEGTTITQNLAVKAVSPDFQAVGRGDYDGDGYSDILWRDSPTGALWIIFMHGNAFSSSEFVTQISDFDWQVVGNGDYNGDGKADILWRNAVTGDTWMYLMNGSTRIDSTRVGAVPDINWQIVGSGDYDGDGRSDILWRNAVTGTTWMFLMNGATILTSIGVSVAPDLYWEIKGNGDYDGDGKSDILWRHAANGTNWVYLMNGTAIAASTWVSRVPDLNWHVVGDGDYDGDGRSDVLWNNSVSRCNNIYLMNGPAIQSNTNISCIAFENWHVVNPN